MMRRHGVAFGIAIALLGLAGALVFTASDARERPLAAPLSALPIAVGAWVADGVPPLEAFAPDPRATDELMRVYRRAEDLVWISVAYHARQKDGHRAAARELLLPGHTWSLRDERPLSIRAAGAEGVPLHATQMVLESPHWRLALIYWYQLPGRTAASEHWYRGLLLYNRIVHQRADAALVRIATPLRPDEAAGRAVSAQLDFVHDVYRRLPSLLQRSHDDRGGRS